LVSCIVRGTCYGGIIFVPGVPFNDTVNIHMDIVEHGERILGNNLLGFQVGNEPDLYASYVHIHYDASYAYRSARHLHRPQNYGPFDYNGEFGKWRDAWNNDANVQNKTNLIGPSLSLATWKLEDVWNTGFLDTYKDSLTALSVERQVNVSIHNATIHPYFSQIS
jgi:hypothetical protein